MRKTKQHSLSEKTVHSTVVSCIMFGVVTLVFALILYAAALTRQYIGMADGVARQVKMSVTHGADPFAISEQTMVSYHSLSEEQRARVGTEEYRGYFSDVDITEKGGAYDVLVHMLAGSLGYHEEIYDIYLGMYDRDTCALVYIVDPDPNEADRMMPGDWETVDRKEVQRFLDGSDEETRYDISWTKKYGLLCTVGVPVRNDAGEITAFVLADVSLDSLLRGMKDLVWKFTLTIILLTLLIAFLQVRRIKRRLVQPIREIAQASRRFAEHTDGDTEHFTDLDVHTGDELEHLVRTMADMEHSLREYGADLMKITAEKERISTELSLAKEIQASMLPHVFPPYPDRTEFDIFAFMEPAREVGGDFYDFFLIDEDHLCLVMADVSGKGIPAALFMMISKTILQSCAMLGISAGEILTKTNEALCSNNQADMFVTVWLGILEISTGTLTCANAGHEYPVIRRKEGMYALYKDKHGMAVGGMDGTRYKEYTLALAPGDTLFLYTDGVPEATDAQQEMFGNERMLAALNAHPDASPRELLSHVRGAVQAFVQETEQFDDLTMLCIAYKGISQK